MVPFSLSPDWTNGIKEHSIYLTDVLTSYDGTEQRVQLLSKPRRGFDFLVMTESQKDVALMTALLYSWQSKVYGLPVWTEAALSTGTLTIGGTALAVDTTYMDLSGGFVIAWYDMHTWEAFEVDSYTSSSITLKTAASRQWPINTVIMPVINTRLELRQQVDYLTPDLAIANLRFTSELV